MVAGDKILTITLLPCMSLSSKGINYVLLKNEKNYFKLKKKVTHGYHRWRSWRWRWLFLLRDLFNWSLIQNTFCMQKHRSFFSQFLLRNVTKYISNPKQTHSFLSFPFSLFLFVMNCEIKMHTNSQIQIKFRVIPHPNTY